MTFHAIITAFCFGYPFVAAFYWISGGWLYVWLRGRHEPRPEEPPRLWDYPGVSVLVPCHNEERQLAETFGALTLIDYPNFEIVAIDDGSTDRTGAWLDALTLQMPALRVVHLDTNQGKSTAMNTGALAARHELLVCIDGDALLEPHALTWLVRRFQTDARIGGLTGNPRVRNHATLLGRLQVGEFSSLVGLIKRAQTVYGSLFTVSGVICAFRKRALQDAGWWSRTALTDDVDVSWRVQLAGWRLAFEPKALCWILMPETLRGLWRQRVRWSEGGTTVMLTVFPALLKQPRLLPVWINFVVSTCWAYAVGIGILSWAEVSLLSHPGPNFLGFWPAIGLHPHDWGQVLALTYLAQALTSAWMDERFERGIFRSLFWLVWYPLVFWIFQALSSIVGLPRAIWRLGRMRGTWVSPDRGVRLASEASTHPETPAQTSPRDGELPVKLVLPLQWPPWIPPAQAPWWMRFRDLVLTIAAWLAYLWILREPLVVFIGWLHPGLGVLLRKMVDVGFEVDLVPFLWVAAVLIAWITLFGVFRRQTLSRQPDALHAVPALPPEPHFGAAGVPVSQLPVWREARCLHVHYDEGRITSVTVTSSS
ncbi:poly-beta-1,6-N-acetyl-D-glucosamine synthase [Paraburkholderia sp. BL10I2N1]|uniref:poly-beta-1,6-N-acetyl-D-glucosamine synthase n=1 Tax=Paraburkholderia sp. BL10I2N1 TaxID=1938796 RepID=UPI0010D14067|nr:poly-beta-1,6-N-acetyl-D-glucosamine synthase [Paraburkholderia sp. BL10I2N1]TDN67016.1 poly-beta-1,6 N-acetyl-D-glucosamine synthase [Paraburkholderia sp. BL10I2N1]